MTSLIFPSYRESRLPHGLLVWMHYIILIEDVAFDSLSSVTGRLYDHIDMFKL